MTYLKNPEKVEGGQRKVWVSEDDEKDLLAAILKELKMLNLQMSIITDNEVNKDDLDQ